MKTKILSPLRRDGYKAGMIMMLIALSTMLLTTACSSEDDFVNNNENNIKQGYTLPVTINVTREGDATTRATYNESTGKLSFSSGDQLFVSGIEATAGKFAGTLTWQSGGTFSGTLTIENEFTGTAQELLIQAYQAYLVDHDNFKNFVSAILLPAGYNNYEFITLKTNNGYDATISTDLRKTFALTKAAAVEQFSLESTSSYSNGFSLYPSYGILNFTITGLTPNTDVNVNFSDYTPAEYGNTMVGTVHTDGSGNATFAVAVYAYSSKNIQTCSLYVNGNPIALVNSSKPIDAGHIYNITRAVPVVTDLSTINANYTASDGETLTGTLASNVKISIADGATVTLNNVNINGTNKGSYEWAGITCLGDATIILSGTNTVKGFYEDYPGIQAAAGNTLTINGTGSLTASSNGYGAGIGGGVGIACGDIEIQGGTITATSVDYSAGIGGGDKASCGNITISGGTVTATGGYRAAGIGGGRKGMSDASGGTCGNIIISGGTVTATGGEDAAGIGGGRGNSDAEKSSCGTITITTGVTKVTATMGDGATNSIGAGKYGTCGTVTIGGNEGAITTSPYTYQP